MKIVNKMIRVGIVCTLSLAVAACETIDCDDAKQAADETITVTLTKKPSVLGDIVSGTVSGLGAALPIPGGSTAAGNVVRRAADRAFSAAEIAAIEREAIPEAEAFIRGNSGTFCDKCPDDKPCQATGDDLKLKLISSNIGRPNRRGEVKITLKFKITAGKVSCGPCEECTTKTIQNKDDKVTNYVCDSKKQVVVDGQPYDAELVAELLSADNAELGELLAH